MAKKIFKQRRVTSLPSKGNDGDHYLLQKPNGRFGFYIAEPNGDLIPVQGVTDEELNRINNDYTNSQIDQRFNDVERDVLGKITTSQTLVQLNALADGIYEAQTEGAYANGITAKSGYTTKFQKVGTTWTLFSEVKLPIGINGKTIEQFNPTKPSGYVAGDQVFFNGDTIYEVKSGQTATTGQSPDTNPEKFKEVFRGVDKLSVQSKSPNLYNSSLDKDGYKLASGNGLSAVSAGNSHSSSVKINPKKTYVIGKYPQINSTNSFVAESKVLVFKNSAGVLINSTSTGWGTYMIHTAVGDTNHKYGYYELVPASEIEVDWKTNGKNRLPIPADADSIEFNTVNGVFNYKDSFIVVEKSEYNRFRKYSQGTLDYFSKSLTDLLKKVTVANHFNKNVIRRNQYINGTTGALSTQAPVEGLVYAVSDYIDVSDYPIWYIQGRDSQDKTNVSHTALAWYDSNFNLIAPIKEDGSNYKPYPYLIGYENGVVYKPANAKYIVFTCLFKASETTLNNIMFTPYTEYISNYLAFGEYITRSVLLANDNVKDGQLMVKQGNTFKGVDYMPNDYDGIYRVINFLASGITKTQQLTFEHTNSLPNDDKPRIVWHDGKLKLVINGVAKEFDFKA